MFGSGLFFIRWVVFYMMTSWTKPIRDAASRHWTLLWETRSDRSSLLDIVFVCMLLICVCWVVQLSVLTGDFLLSRACTALASLNNTEVSSIRSVIEISPFYAKLFRRPFDHVIFNFKVLSLMATAIDNLVRGETMQATASSDQRCRYACRHHHWPCVHHIHSSNVRGHTSINTIYLWPLSILQHGVLYEENILQDSFSNFE